MLTKHEKKLLRTDSHCLWLKANKTSLQFLLRYNGFLACLKAMALLYQAEEIMDDEEIIEHCVWIWRSWVASQPDRTLRRFDLSNTGTREDVVYSAIEWLGYKVVDDDPDVEWIYYNKARNRYLHPQKGSKSSMNLMIGL